MALPPNLFTSVMLAFSKFLEGKLLNGEVIGWLCGIVILVPIVVHSERKKTDKLCFNPSKYKDGVEIL